MGANEFAKELETSRFKITGADGNRVMFLYEIEVGRFAGRVVELGFVVPNEFPFNPPSGPHLSPHLVPLHPANDLPHPSGGVHASDQFGANWQYWSRPYHNWAKTDRSTRAYLAFIRRLFETQ
jgi:hypothetical protein